MVREGIERNRETRLSVSATPVMCRQSGHKVGRVPLSSQRHGHDRPGGEPQNHYKSRLLVWELHLLHPETARYKHSTISTSNFTSWLWSCVFMSASTFLLSGMITECKCVNLRQDQAPMGEMFNLSALPEAEQEKKSTLSSIPPLHPHTTFLLLAFLFCGFE